MPSLCRRLPLLLILVFASSGCTSPGSRASTEPERPAPAPARASATVEARDFHDLAIAVNFPVRNSGHGDDLRDAKVVATHSGQVLAEAEAVSLTSEDGGLVLAGEVLVGTEIVAGLTTPGDRRESIPIEVHVHAETDESDLFGAMAVEAPILRAPAIELSRVTLLEHGPLEARFEIELTITNPNPWPIDVERVRVTPEVDGATLDPVDLEVLDRLLFQDGAAPFVIRAATRFVGQGAALYDVIGESGAHDVALEGRAWFSTGGPVTRLSSRIDDAGRFSW